MSLQRAARKADISLALGSGQIMCSLQYDRAALTLPAGPAKLCPLVERWGLGPSRVPERTNPMARVKLIVNKEDIAPEHHALFDKLAALRGRISGPSTGVLHSPGLARPWNEISEYLHRESIVEPEHAELAVCATAREKDCGYVWNAHVSQARKAGLAAGTLDAGRARRPVDGLPGPEQAVGPSVRQLVPGKSGR